MEGNDTWFIGSVGPNTSTSITWITLTFGTDIPGPQRMNPNNSDDPLVFDYPHYFGFSFKKLSLHILIASWDVAIDVLSSSAI